MMVVMLMWWCKCGGGGKVVVVVMLVVVVEVVRWCNNRNSVRRLRSVRRLINSIHRQKMKFECSICNHSFSRRDAMQRHSRNVHGHGTDSELPPNIHTNMTFQHPFSMMVTGPSASGKTEWTRKRW